jgi:hypothetical protein
LGLARANNDDEIYSPWHEVNLSNRFFGGRAGGDSTIIHVIAERLLVTIDFFPGEMRRQQLGHPDLCGQNAFHVSGGKSNYQLEALLLCVRQKVIRLRMKFL